MNPDSNSTLITESLPRPTLMQLLKKGNISSLYAALTNWALVLVKLVVFLMTSNPIMYASLMHTGADALNQSFVFFGSVASEYPPTKRFPNGFGNVINIFCVIAVVVIGNMAYHTILEGIHVMQHPEPTEGFWLNLGVFTFAVLMEYGVLVKASKEVLHESGQDASGFGVVFRALASLKFAAPATRLVFYEDSIAVSGGVLALLGLLIAHFTGFYIVDGIVSLIIGIVLFGVAVKLGYENTIGLIGVAAPEQKKIEFKTTILADHDVKGFEFFRATQEGRNYHIDAIVELTRGLSHAEAVAITLRIRETLWKKHRDVTDIMIASKPDEPEHVEPNQPDDVILGSDI